MYLDGALVIRIWRATVLSKGALMMVSRPRAFILIVACISGRLADADDGLLFKVRGTGTGVAVSADGAVLASTDGGGEIRMWNLAEGRQIHQIEDAHANGNALAFAPGGGILATTSGKAV